MSTETSDDDGPIDEDNADLQQRLLTALADSKGGISPWDRVAVALSDQRLADDRFVMVRVSGGMRRIRRQEVVWWAPGSDGSSTIHFTSGATDRVDEPCEHLDELFGGGLQDIAADGQGDDDDDD
jgi:hypothetical protein